MVNFQYELVFTRLALLAFLASTSPYALALTVLGFTPNIENDCHSETWNINSREGDDCQIGNGDYPRWSINGVHETAAFKQGMSGDIRLADPILDVEYTSRANQPDRYDVQIELDKINHPGYVDHQGRDVRTGFTAILIADTPFARNAAGQPIFDLSEEVYVTVKVKLEELERSVLSSPSWVGEAEARIILGMQAWWDGYKHLIEVNLFRTSGFDRCGPVNVLTQSGHPNFPYTWKPLLNEIGAVALTSAYPSGLELGPICDPTNRYDHKFVSLDGSGNVNRDHVTSESVYYNVENMPISSHTPLAVGTGFKTFTFPLSALFRDYDWRVVPANWAAVKSWNSSDPTNGYIAINFGMEIYGAGRAKMVVRDLLVWKPLPP